MTLAHARLGDPRSTLEPGDLEGKGTILGAWGTGPFENDAALDWLDEVIEGDGWSVVVGVLTRVGDAYVDVDEGSSIVAAGELVAAACGKPVADLPDEALEWLEQAEPPTLPPLIEKAVAQVERVVKGESELSQLWAESSEGAAWRESVGDLLERLAELRVSMML